jgi:alpha-L-fucosidase 2
LSLPDTHEWITREFQRRQMPNGFLQLLGDTRGNYSEQTAAAGIVAELLLQSVSDIIRVFPCWPKEKDAGFSKLRAQGGFLVTAEQKAGKIVKLEITSTVGGKLRLLNPWTGKIDERQTKQGEKIEVRP